MKFFNLLLFLLFGYFSAVQYNDPDSWLWIILYGGVAISALLAFFNRTVKPLIYVLTLGILFGIVLLFPSFYKWLSSGMESISGTMQTDKPYIEEVREFLGLCISLIAVIIFFLQTKKKS